jgi:hypothetical protein
MIQIKNTLQLILSKCWRLLLINIVEQDGKNRNLIKAPCEGSIRLGQDAFGRLKFLQRYR